MFTAPRYASARLGALALFVVLAYAALFSVRQPDYALYLVPWAEALRADGFGAFETAFSNYTSPYLSALWITTRAEALIGQLGAIKAAGLIGVGLCAAAFTHLLNVLGADRRAAATGALCYLALPSVMLNGVAWGQADAFYAAPLLMSVAAAIRGRLGTAALWFCLAFAVKAQAVFLAPFLAGALLRSPRAVAMGMLAVLPVYLAANLPMLMAGRPPVEVLTIYAGQADHFELLALAAPNPWSLLMALAPPSALAAHYDALVATGLAMATAGGLLVLRTVHVRTPLLPRDAIALAALCALAIPFVLPKMHERFFYTGEVLLLAAALTDRRYLAALACAQIAAVLAYAQYHDTFGVSAMLGELGLAPVPLAAMAMTGAIALAWRAWRAAYPASSCGSIGASVCAPAVTAGARPAARGSRFSA